MTDDIFPEIDPFASEPVAPADVPEPETPATDTPEPDETPDAPAEPDVIADVPVEPGAPVITYAPTVVNPQAHEPIQAGERAQVGQTVDVSTAQR